jgi:hypothetical protein
MKRRDWQVLLGLGLVALSALFYFVHYLIFHDPHHIFIYMVGDIAFVPIEVLMVTLILHELLRRREKRTMLKKLNMVIGAFFSEVGTELLQQLAAFDPDRERVAERLRPTSAWTASDFDRATSLAVASADDVDARLGDLPGTTDLLVRRRAFLLRLLENPNLLEHEAFTDLLWGVFHLTEELAHRSRLDDLPASDLEHLSGDIQRAYRLLIAEWLSYMQHLQESYPYLFSLAIRSNPFDPDARVEVVPQPA